MEPTFTPEVKREKNMTIATIFSGVILLLTVLLFVVLAKSNSNIQNFPKSTFAFLMNVLFVGVLGLFAYILFLFWTKYNILQTMFCFVVLFIPVSFIVYKDQTSNPGTSTNNNEEKYFISDATSKNALKYFRLLPNKDVKKLYDDLRKIVSNRCPDAIMKEYDALFVKLAKYPCSTNFG